MARLTAATTTGSWLPVISRALLHGKDDRNLLMIYTMSGPPLPESMQGTPPINLLLDSVDPVSDGDSWTGGVGLGVGRSVGCGVGRVVRRRSSEGPRGSIASCRSR